MKALRKWLSNHLALLIVIGVAVLCAVFISAGKQSPSGSITLDGSDAQIEDYTLEFVEDSKAALARIMNEDKPTDELTQAVYNEDAVGLGFYTTINDILSRRLPDGNNDGGNGWQCSRYTAWLATGKWSYSALHPDYGPVNGKDVAAWLVRNYGFKYIDQPVEGAIGSGGFNTQYGHTAMYLYPTGANTAMVNDANYVPLTVSTHNMNITDWVWVVPGDYTPAPQPAPAPEPEPEPISETGCAFWDVKAGDTMSKIMLECENTVVYGEAMNAYADTWYSLTVAPNQSVYEGWRSKTGVGLYAGDTIEHRTN